MYKLIRWTRTIQRLSDSFLGNQTMKINCLFNKAPTIHNKNNQISLNYCSEASNPSRTHLPGVDSDINIEKLTQNDPEQLKRLQIIILEVDVMRQEGLKIPESGFIKEHHWEELLLKTSRSQRKKYLEFLWKVEKKKENRRTKQDEAKIERENRPEYVDDGHIRYGLNHNTFFIRIYDTTINHMYNAKLINQTQFGQPLVIDCGYDAHMTTRECYNCAKQIMLAFSDNRFHDEPFDLHLCNASPSSPTLTALGRHIATLYEPWFPLYVHEESYLTAKFPSLSQGQRQPLEPSENPQMFEEKQKKKLVYLTPHCREEMTEFDHDAVYIIGGIVDKVNQEPLSLAKAKRENIPMKRLPLDRYLSWGSGSGKSLTLNQMMLILLDLRRTGDWDFALRHVPRRKVLGPTSITRNSERGALSYDRNDKERKFWGDKSFERNLPRNDFGFNRNSRRNNFERNNDRGTLSYDRNDKTDETRTFDNLKGEKTSNTKNLIKELLKN